MSATLQARQDAAPAPHITFPDLASIPALYALQVASDDPTLDLRTGDQAVFSRDDEVKAGDTVCVILRPEHVQPGTLQCAVRRLVTNLPPYVTLPLNEHPDSDVRVVLMMTHCGVKEGRADVIACDRLLAVHKLLRVQNRGGR